LGKAGIFYYDVVSVPGNAIMTTHSSFYVSINSGYNLPAAVGIGVLDQTVNWAQASGSALADRLWAMDFEDTHSFWSDPWYLPTNYFIEELQNQLNMIHNGKTSIFCIGLCKSTCPDGPQQSPPVLPC